MPVYVLHMHKDRGANPILDLHLPRQDVTLERGLGGGGEGLAWPARQGAGSEGGGRVSEEVTFLRGMAVVLTCGAHGDPPTSSLVRTHALSLAAIKHCAHLLTPPHACKHKHVTLAHVPTPTSGLCGKQGGLSQPENWGTRDRCVCQQVATPYLQIQF